jgi:glucosylceramidase
MRPPAFTWTADRTSFLKDHLLPAFAAGGITTKVLIYDFNWDNTAFPQTVLADLATSPQIAGIAWHWYGGPPGAMTTLRNLYPATGNYVTEASGGTWISDEVRTDFETITHAMRNWSRSFVKWGMALDQNRGPNSGGCSTCTPLITVNDPTGDVTYTTDYYTLGHFSKFVLPGAVRVYSNNLEGVVNAAFVNPDNSRALVAYTLPALAGATFTWNPEPLRRFPVSGAGPLRIGLPGNPARPYTFDAEAFPVQASSYTALSNLQSEACTDANGGYDLGFAADGGWAEWTTVSAPVSNVRGVHNLYVVFRAAYPANGIANLNWFRFRKTLCAEH